MNAPKVEQYIIEKAEKWLSPVFDDQTRDKVKNMLASDPAELIESFYTDLDFGTGGLRGIMGVGTNRINRYTLGQATQGLSNYLKKNIKKPNLSVAIAHDTRNNSKTFARQVAEVLAANGIKAYLFNDFRPTPLLSFAVRHLGCDAGIVLTASHNPKEYNGYKVYWNDGGQLVPPHDKGVIAEVREVKMEEVKFNFDDSLVEYLEDSVENAYLDQLKKLSLSNVGKKDLKIVFTALHGTSVHLLPKALHSAGFSHVQTVVAQDIPDGNFPTVKSPNPEEAAALDLAVQQAEKAGADIVIGCDPDADRVGIAVRNTEGKMELLNGNQTGSLLVDYVLKMNQQNGTLPTNGFVAETVVTTDLIEKIATYYGVPTKKCLTGFKWIAELIRLGEGKESYIVGGEESYGYLIGDFVRDKDAIASAVMIAEVAAHAKANGKTLLDELIEIYVRNGFYLEHLISITKTGKAGLEKIQEMIEGYRNTPPAQLGGSDVVEILDYKSGVAKNVKTGKSQKINLPASNFVQFITADGDKVTARPSGTEPKIKFYFSVKAQLLSKKEFALTKLQLQKKINSIISDLGA